MVRSEVEADKTRETSEEVAMVMVQLKEAVVPSCASGAGEWSRLIVSEFEFSCPCFQEAFTDFLSLPLGPALVVLALHCGAESDT